MSDELFDMPGPRDFGQEDKRAALQAFHQRYHVSVSYGDPSRWDACPVTGQWIADPSPEVVFQVS